MTAPILRFGPIAVELRHGDVLTAPADVLCCPVDTACQSDKGLFGVLRQRKAFPPMPLGRLQRLRLGDTILVPMENVSIKNAALLAILNQQTITVNRESVQQSLRQAVGSSRVDLQACKLEYSIVSPK